VRVNGLLRMADLSKDERCNHFSVALISEFRQPSSFTVFLAEKNAEQTETRHGDAKSIMDANLRCN
jgi:hypothetical protein